MLNQSTELPLRIVHVVEDDDGARNATARLLRAAGHAVRTYRTGAEFLGVATTSSAVGCVVLDLQLPDVSGLDVQRELTQSGAALPVVFLSGRGDVPRSVQAMKSGAVDFLTKGADGDVLLDAVSRALARGANELADRARRKDLRARYEQLSPREREVFAHVISGQLNKQVGFDLGISEQTIKIHRQRVLRKMQADSIPHLVRMAGDLGIAPIGHVR